MYVGREEERINGKERGKVAMKRPIKTQAADSLASAAASSSCNFFRDGGGRGTMLFFHFLSSFLDNLLLIPSSNSLSLFTVSIRAIYFQNSTKKNMRINQEKQRGAIIMQLATQKPSLEMGRHPATLLECGSLGDASRGKI